MTEVINKVDGTLTPYVLSSDQMLSLRTSVYQTLKHTEKRTGSGSIHYSLQLAWQ